METATAAYEQQITSALASYLVARGIDKGAATGARLGLCDEPMIGHESFAGRLAIPYVTPAGVVAIRFRDLTGRSSAKYLGLPNVPTRLYNARVLADPIQTVVVCEGELDALVMSARVGVPAVGVPGISNWKEHYQRCFADVTQVFVCFDNDASGDDTNRGQDAARVVTSKLPGATIIVPPEGRDVSEWFVEEGADAIRKTLGLN